MNRNPLNVVVFLPDLHMWNFVLCTNVCEEACTKLGVKERTCKFVWSSPSFLCPCEGR